MKRLYRISLKAALLGSLSLCALTGIEGGPAQAQTTVYDPTMNTNLTNLIYQLKQSEANIGAAGTGTVAATSQLGAGVTAQASNWLGQANYQTALQGKQFDITNTNNPSTNLIALCPAATVGTPTAALITGGAAAQASFSSGKVYGGGSGGKGKVTIKASSGDTTAQPGGNPDNYNPTASAPARVKGVTDNIYSSFCSKTTDGGKCASSCATPYRDTDVNGLQSTLTFQENGTCSDVNAYIQYISYITGQPPENPSTDTTYRASAKGMEDVAAQRSRISFANTAALAFQQHWANRLPLSDESSTAALSSDVTTAITNLYTQAGITPPNNTGDMSLDSLYQVMYEIPLANQQTFPMLAQISDPLALARYQITQNYFANYMNYQIYKTERQNLEVNSAVLALLARVNKVGAE